MKIKGSDRLGTEPIGSLLLKLSIPSIIGMATQAMYNVVDSIFVGRVSTKALEALSLAFPIQMILIAVAVGTGIGTSALISRLLGEKREHMASNVAEHALSLTLVYGLIFGLLGFFFGDQLIRFFTSDLVLQELATRYIRIILLGSIFMFVPMISNNILRGEGNTFIPMVTMLIGAILNIILDPFFIFGIGFFPEMGVEGAALATVLSRVISGTFILFILLSDKNQLKLKLRDFKFDFSIIVDIYRVGFPAMIMQFLASFMMAGLNLILEGYPGPGIAVLGIFFRLQSFVFMPVFGLNQGYIPIIGYNYGHGNPGRMKKTIKYGLIISFLFTAGGFVLFQVFPHALIRLFNQEDQELLRMGTLALRRISLAFPIIGPAILGSATFQAIGKGFPSLVLSVLRQMIVLLPAAYILGQLFGVDSIWYAFPISELISGIVAVFWLTSTMRKILHQMEKNNAKEATP